ncbi:MAG: hypothetical protein ABSB67_15400 [Bryobacteraceae bacterium]
MRRVLCAVLLLALGMAPALEAHPRVQLSKRQQRKQYVAKPYKVKKYKLQRPPKTNARWRAPKR